MLCSLCLMSDLNKAFPYDDTNSIESGSDRGDFNLRTAFDDGPDSDFEGDIDELDYALDGLSDQEDEYGLRHALDVLDIGDARVGEKRKQLPKRPKPKSKKKKDTTEEPNKCSVQRCRHSAKHNVNGMYYCNKHFQAIKESGGPRIPDDVQVFRNNKLVSPQYFSEILPTDILYQGMRKFKYKPRRKGPKILMSKVRLCDEPGCTREHTGARKGERSSGMSYCVKHGGRKSTSKK